MKVILTGSTSHPNQYVVDNEDHYVAVDFNSLDEITEFLKSHLKKDLRVSLYYCPIMKCPNITRCCRDHDTERHDNQQEYGMRKPELKVECF